MNDATASLHSLRALLVAGALALVSGLTSVASGALVKTPQVEAELVAAQTALVPGQAVSVALRLAIEKGWHTYWRNPGDSGLPTTLAWKLPAGYVAGDIEWPAPHALPAGPLINYGYEGTVLHLVTLQVPKDAAVGGRATLAARADWLVCKETCIPDGADLTLTLPVAKSAAADSHWAGAIDATRAALPRPLANWETSAVGEGDKILLKLRAPAGAADPGTLHFFAYAENQIEPSAPQPIKRDETGAFVLTLPVSSQLAEGFKRIDGVLTASNGLTQGTATLRAATLEVPLQGAILAGPRPATEPAPALRLTPDPAQPAAATTLVPAMLFALLGGLILNLMPCVFPVLSLKAMSLAAPGHDDRRVLRLQGVAFAVGVIATFVALAGALLALRAAGQQLGWGFQLQSPSVVVVLALLFFVIALNLSGVFEFGSLAPSSAAGWTVRNPYADSLLSGVLAVIIASPCTAPFMGAALGFALAQPTADTIAVFVALGLGMALPYLLLAWFPGWRRLLPRPGAWMERMKQFLAFPLYGTVAWLAWVLGAQVDNDAVVRLLVTLVVIAFALWAWRAYRGGGTRAWAVTALVAVLAGATVAWPLFTNERDEPSAEARASPTAAPERGWSSYSATKVADLEASGRPVFVDFTAAWCVTCQVNKRMVLGTAVVRDAFARRNVAMLRADWTRRDPAITRALAALGRNGVPVYVLYRPGKEPLLLPEVLHKQTVLDALASF
jgi:thiol:disulfide interchange protein